MRIQPPFYVCVYDDSSLVTIDKGKLLASVNGKSTNHLVYKMCREYNSSQKDILTLSITMDEP